jgi:AsmA protein
MHTVAIKDDPAKIPAWLKTLRLRGSLTANAISWDTITADSTRATFRANKGILRIYPIQARILDGRIAGNIRADLTGSRPVITMTTDLRGLRIKELTDRETNSTNILGTITAFVKSTYTGTPWSPDQSTIKGTVSLRVTNGTLVGMDLKQAGKKLESNQRFSTSPRVHPFDTLSFQGALQDGMLSTQDFILKSDTLDFEGTGMYDLANDHIQGELRDTAPDPLKGVLSISGSLYHPTTRWKPEDTPGSASLPTRQGSRSQDTHLSDTRQSHGD